MTTHLTWIKKLTMVLAFFLCLAGVTKFVASMAQNPSQQEVGPDRWKVKKVAPKRMGAKTKLPGIDESDRVIEDHIPPSVPLEVEIKNLKPASLLHDIEVKVTNISKKPIYFLKLGIVLPENLSAAGYPMSFPLQ